MCVSVQWYTLNDVKSGSVRLILEWVPAVSHNATLDQVSAIYNHLFMFPLLFMDMFIEDLLPSSL